MSLICPACGRELTNLMVSGVALDVCQGGCGGIWFDNFEFKKFDEPHEPGQSVFASIQVDPSLEVDHEMRRNCPKCDQTIMMRHFSGPARNVQVDSCPNCGGYWLDAGEILQIREEQAHRVERQKTIDDFVRSHAEPLHTKMRLSPKEGELRVRRLQNALHFLAG